MIELKNFTKIYGNRALFENFNVIFEDFGMYSIVGNSGCGKSTLLNCISTLDTEYEGEIFIENKNLKSLKDDEIKTLRINKFGFIFQSYNLFENETVFNNVKLVQFHKKGIMDDVENNDVYELLKRLKIYEIKDSLVKYLSGGEKQRVAIARALINKPEVLFCDEPTGSLDDVNSDEIFKILKEISLDHLVIVVTHDKERAKFYSDYILNIKKKKLIQNKEVKNKKINKSKYIFEGKIGFKYILRSIKNTMRSRKLRYFISTSMFSLSLICLGLTIFVSQNISQGISKAFSNLIPDNSLILRKIGNNSNLKLQALNKDEASSIYFKYHDDIKRLGTKFLIDFKEFFPEINSFYYEKNNILDSFVKLSATSINNFKYIDPLKLHEHKTYPRFNSALEDDELIVSMDYKTMEDLCLNLRIQRDFETLGDYLKTKPLKMIFKATNSNWNYSDEQVFYLRAVIPMPNVEIYHTNSLFNERIFKDYMRFPITEKVFDQHDLPWIMKQVYFIESKKFQTDLLNKIQYDAEYENLIFESDNSYYSPDICVENELCYSNRIYLYKSLNDIFETSIIKQINNINKEFKDYYFSTPGGYMNYGGSLFNGFSKEMFFSLDLDRLKNVADRLEKIKIDDYNSIDFNDKVASGYALNTNEDNVRFSIKFDGKYQGLTEFSSKMIGISSALARRLGGNNLIGKDIYLMMNYETKTSNNFYYKKFKIAKLEIAGIVDSNSFKIYQNKDFSISLFRDFFQQSSFELIPESIVFEFDKKPSKEVIKSVNEKIPNYELIDPFNQIDSSMDEIFEYFKYGLLAFTLFTSISTILLMFVVNAINFEDDKKEIAIYQMLGFKQKEVNKMQLCKNFSYTLPSLFTSILTLILISMFLGKVLEHEIGIEIGFNFPYQAILGIVGLTIFMTFISYFVVINHIKKAKLTGELHKMT